jgi:hypothetical protein
MVAVRKDYAAPTEGVTRYNGGGCCSMDSFLKLLFG